MNVTILIIVVVILYTLIWPIYKFSMAGISRPESIGAVNSITSAALGAAMMLATGQAFTVYTLIFGTAMGISYSAGFCILVGNSLKTTPSSMLTTVNNLGFLWPVMLNMLWYSKGEMPGWGMVTGIFLVLLSLAAAGFKKNKGTQKNGRGLLTSVSIWILSGISMTAQYLSGYHSPGNNFAFATVVYVTSFLILTAMMLAKREKAAGKREFFGGAAIGVINIIGLPAGTYLLSKVPAAVVFPVTIATPIILISVAGVLLFKEKPGIWGWVSNAAGIIGIVLLTALG